MCGEVSRSHAWKLDVSYTTTSSAPISGKISSDGCPIFPTNQTVLPAAFKIDVIIVEVVPLPFVPVTPIIGAGHFAKNSFVPDQILPSVVMVYGDKLGVRITRSNPFNSWNALSPSNVFAPSG